jgi:hypothetical protein
MTSTGTCASWEARPGYICECLDTACSEMIEMPHDEYERIRRNPNEFFVLPGHEDLRVEMVVDQTDRWLVVQKLGVGAEIAKQLSSDIE